MISAKYSFALILGMSLSLAMSSDVAAQENAPRNPPVRSGASRQGQPSKYLFVPGLEPLALDSVQQEIQLTADQKQQLKQVSDAFQIEMQDRQANMQNEMRALRDMPEAEQDKRAAALEQRMNQQMGQSAQGTRRKAEAILSQKQLAKMHEIAFRLFVAGNLGNMNAQQHLGLDPHQRQQITAIYEDLEEQLHRMQRNTASQILKTLTPEQEAELRKDMDNPPQQRRQ